MATEENIHSGHRERMTEKLLNNANTFCDHELLEVLLFNFLPRVDTNATAHRLLNTFGTLQNLFNASAQEILSVDGIGKKTAEKIVLLGKIMERVYKQKETLPNKPFDMLNNFKDDIIKMFEDTKAEKIIIILLDKKNYPFVKLEYCGGDYSSVSANIEEILHAFAINKPRSVILCHNHPSGNPTPSKEDDFTTAKFYMLCSVSGIVLVDHIIIGKDDKVYSYFLNGKLHVLKENYNMNDLINKARI